VASDQRVSSQGFRQSEEPAEKPTDDRGKNDHGLTLRLPLASASGSGPKDTLGRKDRRGNCSSPPRLVQANQAVEANVSIFDRMTDDEQHAVLTALEALRTKAVIT
jgi:hypothetical protein